MVIPPSSFRFNRSYIQWKLYSMEIIIPNINIHTYIITTEDTESTEGLYPYFLFPISYFLYSVFSVYSVVKLSLEIGEGIWILDHTFSLVIFGILCTRLFLYLIIQEISMYSYSVENSDLWYPFAPCYLKLKSQIRYR